MSHTCRHFLSILIVRKKIQSNDGGTPVRAVMATGGMMMMIKIGACQLAVQTKTTDYMVVSTACCYVIKQGLVANLTPYHVV